MITLNRADPTDIATISEMADKIWHIHYLDIISTSQIDYMLNKFYSDNAVKNSIQNGENYFLINSGGFAVGYISATNTVGNKWFINKFYIYTDIHRKGIGTIAFEQLENILKPSEFSLQVNRKNFKSINFYFKNGFKIKEWANFDIGNGYLMEDYIMIKKYQ